LTGVAFIVALLLAGGLILADECQVKRTTSVLLRQATQLLIEMFENVLRLLGNLKRMIGATWSKYRRFGEDLEGDTRSFAELRTRLALAAATLSLRCLAVRKYATPLLASTNRHDVFTRRLGALEEP